MMIIHDPAVGLRAEIEVGPEVAGRTWFYDVRVYGTDPQRDTICLHHVTGHQVPSDPEILAFEEWQRIRESFQKANALGTAPIIVGSVDVYPVPAALDDHPFAEYYAALEVRYEPGPGWVWYIQGWWPGGRSVPRPRCARGFPRMDLALADGSRHYTDYILKVVALYAQNQTPPSHVAAHESGRGPDRAPAPDRPETSGSEPVGALSHDRD